MSDQSSKTSVHAPHASDVEVDEGCQSETKGQRVPRLCLLDGFAEGLKESCGVNLTRLEALTELRVTTATAVYQITVLEPFRSKVLIQGGTLFADAAEVTLSGASLGRSFLKMSCIWIGLQIELHSGDCTVVTSPVRSIEILEDTFPTGSFAA
ncbi:MAG: hypothetical protein BMS9Abin37_2433 [Acidobacteriota bacterium]|nr:MAG: hypothetical protein BMS9Abin37_2433 [Acidobacteriota bacterium]